MWERDGERREREREGGGIRMESEGGWERQTHRQTRLDYGKGSCIWEGHGIGQIS